MSLLDFLDRAAELALLSLVGTAVLLSVIAAYAHWISALDDAWHRDSRRRLLLLALLPFCFPSLWLLARWCL